MIDPDIIAPSDQSGGSCSIRKFNVMDLPVDGPLTARDARLGVFDAEKQKHYAEMVLEQTIDFWNKKVASIQDRCPHENNRHQYGPDGQETLCADCGKFL